MSRGWKHITESPAVPFIKRPERRGKVRSDREKRGGRGTRGGFRGWGGSTMEEWEWAGGGDEGFSSTISGSQVRGVNKL